MDLTSPASTASFSSTASLPFSKRQRKNPKPTRSVQAPKTEQRDDLGIVKLDVFAVYFANPTQLLEKSNNCNSSIVSAKLVSALPLPSSTTAIPVRASQRQLREKALLDSKKRHRPKQHPVSIQLEPMIHFSFSSSNNNSNGAPCSRPLSPVSSVMDSDEENDEEETASTAATRLVQNFGPFTRDSLPRSSKSKTVDYGADIPGVAANSFYVKKQQQQQQTGVGANRANIRRTGVPIPVVDVRRVGRAA